MTSPSNRDLEQKLQELETELHQAASPTQTQNPTDPKIQPDRSTPETLNFDRATDMLKTTFASLPPAGRVLVVLFGACLVLSVVSGVLRLITSLLVLGIIGTLGYLAYQWFFRD
ncbi:MAG: hypothetical protein AAGA60_22630 [Cyanobacteria bacterium P01_E01_bin.42]